VFDKVRRDNQAPGAYGASITYDLPIAKRTAEVPDALQAIVKELQD
jgi:NitT/TauT family transport system ATP-binding protein